MPNKGQLIDKYYSVEFYTIEEFSKNKNIECFKRSYKLKFILRDIYLFFHTNALSQKRQLFFIQSNAHGYPNHNTTYRIVRAYTVIKL